MSVAAFAAAIRDQFDACLRSDFAAGEGFTKFQLRQTPSSVAGGAGMYFGDTTAPYWCTRVDAAGNLHFDRFSGGAWAADAMSFDRATGSASFGAAVKERGRSTAMGEWVPFTPTITPSSGTYTGYTTTAAKYMLIGKTMWVIVTLENGVLSATPSHVDLTLPGGCISAVTAYVTTNVRNASGGFQFGSATVTAGSTTMIFTLGAEGRGTLWAAGGPTDLTAVFPFEVM